MNFPIVATVALPKLMNQSLNFLDQPFWEFKTAHGIGRNGLDHGFDKHFSTSL